MFNKVRSNFLNYSIFIPLHQYWFLWLFAVRFNWVKSIALFIICLLFAIGHETFTGNIILYYSVFLTWLSIEKINKFKDIPFNFIVSFLFLFGVFQVVFVDTFLVFFEDWSWTGNYLLLRNSVSEGKMITVFGAHNYSAYAYTAIFISGCMSKGLSNLSKLLLLIMLFSLQSGTAYISLVYIILSSIRLTKKKIFIAIFMAIVSLTVFMYFFSGRVLGNESNGFYSRIALKESAWLVNLSTVMNNPSGIGFSYYSGGDSGFLSLIARFGWVVGAFLNMFIFDIIRKKFSLNFALYTIFLSVFLPVTLSIQLMLLLFFLDGNTTYYKK